MSDRTRLFGMPLDPLTMSAAVDEILGWIRDSSGVCRYVVTPNVDHAVLFQANDELRRAYSQASLVLADGMPIVLASRILGRRVPERVAGSDLVPSLFSARGSAGGFSVFLLGAAPGVGERASGRITQQWPKVRVVGSYSPPIGFEHDPAENERILRLIAAGKPDVLVVGLGAPKQELWTCRHLPRIEAKVALCVGASIDFLAGEKSRAPRWMRTCGLEWLHRVAGEPRRLAGRYARDAWIFPQLVCQEIFHALRGREWPLSEAPRGG